MPMRDLPPKLRHSGVSDNLAKLLTDFLDI